MVRTLHLTLFVFSHSVSLCPDELFIVRHMMFFFPDLVLFIARGHLILAIRPSLARHPF